MLRTLLDVADAAPTAGVAVIDNAVTARREDLLGGAADAYDEVAATEDRVVASLADDRDRTQVRAYTTTTLEGFLDQSTAADAIDGSADVPEHATSPAPTEGPRPAPHDHEAPVVQTPITGEDLDAAEHQAGETSGATGAAAATYDRTNETRLIGVGDAEAARARIVSAHGYARSTRNMLEVAQNRPSTPAGRSEIDSPALGRSKIRRP